MTNVAIIRSFGGLVFDATLKEDHDLSSTVTDNPIETGVSVSDHMYRNPDRLTITAGVSDTPLFVDSADPFASDTSRSSQALEQLIALKNAAEPFDIQTGLRLYSNMVCLSIRTSQDASTSGALLFDAECREVIIVNTQTVTYPPRKAGATKRQGDAVKNKGEQQGKEPTTTKKSSLLGKLFK